MMHILLKCAFSLQEKHGTFLAGHWDSWWLGLVSHLGHLSRPFLLTACFRYFCVCFVLGIYFLHSTLSTKHVSAGFSPLRLFCCCLTVSVCLAIATAFSSVRLPSKCSLSDRHVSIGPIWSHINSSFKFPLLQCSAKAYRAVTDESTD